MASTKKTVKVSVVYMGKQEENVKDAKEFILQLQPKAKILNIFEYLHQIGKVGHIQLSVSQSKGGVRIPQNFTIEQARQLSKDKTQPLRFYMYDETPTLSIGAGPKVEPTLQMTNIELTTKKQERKLLESAEVTHLASSGSKISPGKSLNKKDENGNTEKQEKGCCCTLI